MSKPAVYVSGHHESVLRSHSWRSATNSAGYLLGSIKPDMHILDIGCGPGTITIDFATLVPQGNVIGLENAPDVLKQARATAAERGVTNIQFVTGDINALDYPDGTFDVVHCHQVLQHVGDPVHALREMRRVAKPGGIVAAREADLGSWTWYPEVDGMTEWQDLFIRVQRFNGGESNAGRRLHAWAREAGFQRTSIKASCSAWCFSDLEERAFWSNMWADRLTASPFAQKAVESGHATDEDLARISETWRRWGAEEDGWFGALNGEILCHV